MFMVLGVVGDDDGILGQFSSPQFASYVCFLRPQVWVVSSDFLPLKMIEMMILILLFCNVMTSVIMGLFIFYIKNTVIVGLSPREKFIPNLVRYGTGYLF